MKGTTSPFWNATSPSPGAGADRVWDDWERPGLNQFRQPHFMLPRWRAEMERELPEVVKELEAMGGARVNVVGMVPAALTGGGREGDGRFATVTARRPTLEAAMAAVAERVPGVRVLRGVPVTGLVTGRPLVPGMPHIAGVMAGRGRAIRAGLVVDATGRRSPLPGMLDAVGGRRPAEEREDSVFVYYARHFRARNEGTPEALGTPLQHFEGVSILTLPCDNDTWAVAFIASSRDRRLRTLRERVAWERALGMFPTVAHWDAGEPLTGEWVIAGIEDRYRRYVVDDYPAATGLLAVGDAWACTSPSLGRGASIGLLRACALRDVLRETGPDEPAKLAERFDEVTETTVGPLYRMTPAFDRHRLAVGRARHTVSGLRADTQDLVELFHAYNTGEYSADESVNAAACGHVA
ncbi:NAD(P)/FAD-dependent oxidoreductase [Actinomadura sp. 3N407]|uniref:NAD(P)/FAD-dependent oxidoreductase n=1 Tax=Actinomadura sp. 3N407 TaxID=3457423 RepID=UPI003FCC3C6B